MVDMNHKLTNYILAQDKKAKKSKDKKSKKDKTKDFEEGDSDDDDKKKKNKKEKKSKKEKKKVKNGCENGEDASDSSDDKAYLKEAMFGKKSDDTQLFGPADVASEAGVDDEGAMSEFCLERFSIYSRLPKTTIPLILLSCSFLTHSQTWQWTALADSLSKILARPSMRLLRSLRMSRWLHL